jgi:putative ABC transport system substrate-binding protein
VRRRKFIALFGAAALARPLAARAQQPKVPVVGFLSARSADDSAGAVKAFVLGLSEAGFVAGENVTIRFRWAEGHYDRLPTMAAELVREPVAVIAAFGGDPPVRAAKAATATIPIVFTTAGDPVADGLVASLNRPGGNVTGVSFLSGQIGTKIMELLHSMVPKTNAVAVLSNPKSLQGEAESKDVQDAARALGVKIQAFNASSERDLDAVFDTIVQNKIGGLILTADPFLTSQRDRLAELAKRYAIPAISVYRELAVAGVLMGYGASLIDAYRQAGAYVGRILKGEKPAELPIVQPTKFELVINLKTAKALGLEVPPTLIALADEVIE